MAKSTGKRFLSIMLVIVMVLTLLPVIEMSASAANVNTGVDGLTAESSGEGTWSASGGSVPVKVSSGCTGDSYAPQTGSFDIHEQLRAFGAAEFRL